MRKVTILLALIPSVALAQLDSESKKLNYSGFSAILVPSDPLNVEGVDYATVRISLSDMLSATVTATISYRPTTDSTLGNRWLPITENPTKTYASAVPVDDTLLARVPPGSTQLRVELSTDTGNVTPMADVEIVKKR